MNFKQKMFKQITDDVLTLKVIMFANLDSLRHNTHIQEVIIMSKIKLKQMINRTIYESCGYLPIEDTRVHIYTVAISKQFAMYIIQWISVWVLMTNIFTDNAYM